MGKIKAYFDGDQIIPVDQAQVVGAYRCPFTDEVFRYKREYLAHLRSRRSRIHGKIRSNNLDKDLSRIREATAWDEMIHLVEENSALFMENARRHNPGYDGEWPDAKNFRVRITYLSITQDPSVSNSHNCPLNGVTNWGNHRPGAPRGYPGWQGRIEYQTSHKLPIFGRDVFRRTGINTGSGGGITNNCFGFSVELFDADWPAFDQQRILDVLSESKGRRQFTYGTPIYFR